jgi:hypothetical protein
VADFLRKLKKQGSDWAKNQEVTLSNRRDSSSLAKMANVYNKVLQTTGIDKPLIQQDVINKMLTVPVLNNLPAHIKLKGGPRKQKLSISDPDKGTLLHKAGIAGLSAQRTRQGRDIAGRLDLNLSKFMPGLTAYAGMGKKSGPLAGLRFQRNFEKGGKVSRKKGKRSCDGIAIKGFTKAP